MRDSALKLSHPHIPISVVACVGEELMRDSALKRTARILTTPALLNVGEELMRDSALKPIPGARSGRMA